jgi:hypothetical protein
MGSLQDGAPPQTRVVGERKRHSDGWTGGDNYSLFHAKPHNEPAKPMCHSDGCFERGSQWFLILKNITWDVHLTKTECANI